MTNQASQKAVEKRRHLFWSSAFRRFLLEGA
jgi:hypothetical protein